MRLLSIFIFSMAALAGCAATEQSQRVGSAYASAPYGFAFTAPGAYVVREYAPESLSIGRPTPKDGFDAVADIRLYTAGEDVGYDSFDAFSLETLRNMCAADGPEETIDCTEAQQRQPFTTESGLVGEALYFERIHETFATRERAADGFGPIFLFDVSAAVPGAEFAALAIQPPANLPPVDVDSALLRQVASSLSIVPKHQAD